MASLHPKHYFDLASPGVADLLGDIEVVWDILARIGDITARLIDGRRVIEGTVMHGAHVSDGPVVISAGAVLEPDVYVQGPAFIGPHVVLRHGAYVRGNVVLLDGSLLGHASEAKNALFLPGAKAPHFAYVGDSVVGHRVNLGAGTKLSNSSLVGKAFPASQRTNIRLEIDGKIRDTGLAKFGAIIGDDCEVGCNAVLNPGTIIGPATVVYPNATVAKGIYPPGVMIKVRQEQSIVERRK